MANLTGSSHSNWTCLWGARHLNNDNYILFKYIYSQPYIGADNDVANGPIDTERRDEQGRTLLMNAAIRKNLKLFLLLLEQGASIDAVDKDGLTIQDHIHNMDDASLQEIFLSGLSNAE